MIPSDVQKLLTKLAAKNDPDCDRAIEIIDELYNNSCKTGTKVTKLTCANNLEKAKNMVEDIGGIVDYAAVSSDEYGWFISIGIKNLNPIMKITELLVEDCRILIHSSVD